MQTGNIVAVLYGGRTPVVLRKDTNHYRVLGPCYIHQMMDGEAVEMCDSGKLAEEEFELR